jgi:hypothetical protein
VSPSITAHCGIYDAVKMEFGESVVEKVLSLRRSKHTHFLQYRRALVVICSPELGLNKQTIFATELNLARLITLFKHVYMP